MLENTDSASIFVFEISGGRLNQLLSRGYKNINTKLALRINSRRVIFVDPSIREKVDAIKAWRKLAGPTDSIEAKALDPSSLRALYGTDGTRNAVHGSDSFASALREVNFCFNKVATSFSDEREQGSGEAEREGNGGFGPEERTLALLQPGVSELRSGNVLRNKCSILLRFVRRISCDKRLVGCVLGGVVH